MTDVELDALAALVRSESVMMAGENYQREHSGLSAAYTTYGHYAEQLAAELVRRGEVKE